MRTNIVPVTRTGQSQRYTHDGQPAGSPTNYVVRYDAVNVRRSDIVVNLQGSDGWRNPSPYSADAAHRSAAVVSGKISGSTYYWVIDQPILTGVLTNAQLALPTYAQYAQAEVKAMNALANRKGALAETVAEMRSSIQGLSRNADSISRFLHHASRRNWRKAAAAIGLDPGSRRSRRAVDRIKEQGSSLGSAWLNFWFGLSPIVSDMVTVAAFLSNDSIHRKLRVKGTGRYVSKTTIRGEHAEVQFAVPWKAELEQTAYVSLTGLIDAQQLRELAVYGAYDVPSTMWAVMPYSWLIDWVLPVTEVLKAQTAGVGITFRGGTRTLRAFSKSTTGNPYFRGTNVGDLQITPGAVDQLVMRRTVYQSWPNPVTLWVKDPFDLWKGITSLSLLATKLKPLK